MAFCPSGKVVVPTAAAQPIVGVRIMHVHRQCGLCVSSVAKVAVCPVSARALQKESAQWMIVSTASADWGTRCRQRNVVAQLTGAGTQPLKYCQSRAACTGGMVRGQNHYLWPVPLSLARTNIQIIKIVTSSGLFLYPTLGQLLRCIVAMSWWTILLVAYPRYW